MKKILAGLALGLGVAIASPQLPVLARSAPLVWSNPTQDASIGFDEQLWQSFAGQGDKQALIQSIDNSLRYIRTPSAAEAYRNYHVRWITRDRVERSLRRFRQLVIQSQSPAELQAAVKREFVFYKSVGLDNKGSVLFTGYYEPIYAASLQRTEEYRYPLYRRPANFEQWRSPHPTRVQLEGQDGQGLNSVVRGTELVWLRDRLEAYLVQIQGSAKLRLTDGRYMSVGFHGGTDYDYTSVGKLMIRDGLHPRDGFTMPKMINIFRQRPDLLSKYLPQNNRFIFFRNTGGGPPTGSLSVPVTADRSIATDKTLMPPGALALIHTQIPYPDGRGGTHAPTVSRYVLDQDKGSAINTAGRVDVFMGTGDVAGQRAGVMGYRGQLYYLMLRE
ncbi:MAG: murein transglycosylase [Spirulina sp. SIO3F2]|nr:murein transglycosylase [Spirulina sp. SIO3F2]